MKDVSLITALLLCSLSWISVSGSESQTVVVQSDQNVTLACRNISKYPTHTDWFRVVNRNKPSCISSMYRAFDNASFCDGFQNGKFEMTSNTSDVFLKIKRVDSSDSGLYFCGFYLNTHTVIGTAIHLNIEGDAESDDAMGFKNQCNSTNLSTKKPDGMIIIISMILGALTVFLTIVIIVLAVKIKKLHTAVNEDAKPGRIKESPASDNLNYAALAFKEKPKRNRRVASERELEPNVVYAGIKGTAASTGAAASSY